MHYYVKEQPNNQAILIAEDGYPLSTFDSVDDAVAVCIIECRVAPLWIEWSSAPAVKVVDGDCVQQALSNHCKQH